MKHYIHASYAVETIDSKMMAPYKGYKIEKSWSVDSRGKVVKDSIRYAAIDSDDDWIGDMYKTVKEVHDYIDSIVKKGVKASSKLHIKNSSIGSTIKSARNAVKAAEFDAEDFKNKRKLLYDKRRAKKEDSSRRAEDLLIQIRESDDPIQTAFDLLVPSSGKADTEAGEAIRAMMKILYRDFNDGDVFYEGYGIETCGSPVAYLCDQFNITSDFQYIAERQLKDQQYTDAIQEIADNILNAIYEDPQILVEPNTVDMYDYNGEEFIREHGWEPTYDAEIEIPENVYAHLENGDISERDLEYEISSWDYCRDKEISVYGDYLTIYELGIDDYDEIDANMYRWLEEYGNDLDDEYGVPDEEEDDEDYDGEEM